MWDNCVSMTSSDMEPEPEMSLLPEFEEGNSSLKPPPAKRSAVAESDEADSVSPPGSPVSPQSVTEEIPMPMLELRSEENHGYPSGLQPEENPVVMPETESVDNRRNMLVSLFDATLRWMREWPEYLLTSSDMEPEPKMSLLPEFEEGNSSLKPPPAKRSAVAESDEADSVSPPGSPVSTQSVTEEIPMPKLELRSEENHGYPPGLQPKKNPVVMPETESVDN
ncbi:uncharacterized protein [Paralichthys olivaceus]|uniref:uncharacterized protein n=1 Tax=Paralichthys olivaceus TaxID=8255 RepID=UPI00375063AF